MDKTLLLNLAKKAIESNFNKNIQIQKDKILKENAYLKENRATFVTLTLDERLRGCIGSLLAYRTFFDDLLYNAKAAAFSDPRFPSLSKAEFEKIKIEISILTTPKILEYSSLEDLEEKLVPKKHGVILELDDKRATFLPQVWEQLPTFSEFMVHLCKKAGLEPNNLPSLPKIQTYEVQKIK